MIKNRFIQLAYRSCLSLVAIFFLIYTSGYVQGHYVYSKLLYFAYLSNYLCFFYCAIEFCYTLVEILSGEKKGNSTAFPMIKFAAFLSIVTTFIIANTLMTDHLGRFYQASYWQNPEVYSIEFVLPILYMIDYIIFTDHDSIKPYYPFVAAIVPFTYFCFILARAEILGRETYTGTLYPYSFLNVNQEGYIAVWLYAIAILASYLGIGYIIYCYQIWKIKIHDSFENRKGSAIKNREPNI